MIYLIPYELYTALYDPTVRLENRHFRGEGGRRAGWYGPVTYLTDWAGALHGVAVSSSLFPFCAGGGLSSAMDGGQGCGFPGPKIGTWGTRQRKYPREPIFLFYNLGNMV